MNRANVARRALAAALDGIAAIGFVIVGSGMALASGCSGRAQAVFALRVLLLLWILYSSMEVFFAATPGKMLLGLRIAGQNGAKASFWKRLLRWSTKYYSLPIYLLDSFFPGTILPLAGGIVNTFIACGFLGAFNDDRLTFHDQWSGTAVWRRVRQQIPPALPVQYVST